ncbi:MAG: hypothetical protein QOF53_2026 [Nocardioidaceae bacterium]|nr:hypothetical protein [Nocardioidaceae bacterium]
MTDQPTSGSRWEPTPPDRAAHPAAGASAPAPAPEPGSRPAAAETAPCGTGLPLAPDPWVGQYPETSHRSSGDAPTRGVATQDGQRPGVGAPDREGDGSGPRSGDQGPPEDAHDTSFTAEGGNAG